VATPCKESELTPSWAPPAWGTFWADARVVAIVEAALQAAIPAGVDLDNGDAAAGADSRTDQRRAAMAGDVLASTGAGLDVQVLGHAAGDVGRPADVAARMGQGFREVEEIDPLRRGEVGEGDHAATSTVAGPRRRATSRAPLR